MTNNKQQTAVDAAELAFKIYPFSSDEVRNAFITGYNKAKEMECVLLCAKEQRSIEVPSDEEIYYAETQMPMNTFELGAKWMRDKIKGGEQ